MNSNVSKQEFLDIVGSKDYCRLISVLKGIHAKLHLTKDAKQSDKNEQELVSNDLQLDSLLRQIQNRFQYLVEAYDHTTKQCKTSPQLRKDYTERMRQIEIQRKRSKLEEVKVREKAESERRYIKNMERIKRTENVKQCLGNLRS